MSTRSARVALACIVAALSVAGTTRAQEPDPVRLGITPVDYVGQYFDLTMAPGETAEFQVGVANHGSQIIEASTYAATVYTLIGGGFGARLDGEPVTGTALWLEYPAQTLDLPPAEVSVRSFSVTVPADAEPGEYIASLVVQNAKPLAGQDTGVSIDQVQRQAVAVAITVPGPREPGLTIDSFHHQYVAANSVLAVQLTNTGNVRLKPSGRIIVLDGDRREVSRAPVLMDAFYAGDATTIEVQFASSLSPGDYLVSLTLDYEGASVNATDRIVTVVKPTAAEAGGAPTGTDRLAPLDQEASETDSAPFPFPALFLLVAGVAATSAAVWAIRTRPWARPSPDPLVGWSPGDRGNAAQTGYRSVRLPNHEPARTSPTAFSRRTDPSHDVPRPLRPRTGGVNDHQPAQRATASAVPAVPGATFGRFAAQRSSTSAHHPPSHGKRG